MGILHNFKQDFNYIMSVSFIDGGNERNLSNRHWLSLSMNLYSHI